MSKTLTVELSDHLYDRLNLYLQTRGYSREEWVREAIEGWVAVLNRQRRSHPRIDHSSDIERAQVQYGKWLKAIAGRMEADWSKLEAARDGQFRPLFVGLVWPSLVGGDYDWEGELSDTSRSPALGSDGSADSDEQQAIEKIIWQANRYSEQLNNVSRLKSEFPKSLPQEMRKLDRELNLLYGLKYEGVVAKPGDDREGFDYKTSYINRRKQLIKDGRTHEDSVWDALLEPLRVLSFWKMKKRACTVGESGGFQLLQQLQQAAPPARFHLMGHSFGCIVVSAMLTGHNGGGHLSRPVDSLVLLQGALSCYSYCGEIAFTRPKMPGYFYPIVKDSREGGQRLRFVGRPIPTYL
ncbi:MAG: hypothetical protein ACP5D7_14545 [Limnospira sp.]